MNLTWNWPLKRSKGQSSYDHTGNSSECRDVTIIKKESFKLTGPEGGEGMTESATVIWGALSMGVSLLPDGGREDSPSDW